MKRNLILTLLSIIAAAIISGCATTNQVMEQPTAAPATVITGLKITDNTVEVKADGPFIYTIYKPADPYRVALEIPEVSIGQYNEKIISKSAGISEVAPSQITEPKLTAKFEILLQTPSELEPVYKDNCLTLKIKEPLETRAEGLTTTDDIEPLIVHKEEVDTETEEDREQLEIQTEIKSQEPDKDKAEDQQKTQAQNKIDKEDMKGKGSETLQEPLTEVKYTGRKIALKFQDADIVPILVLLADIGGYNIDVSPDVKDKRHTINWEKPVPWDQALDLILKDFSLGKVVEGNIIRIAPLSVFVKESEEMVKARKAEAENTKPEKKQYTLRYANAANVGRMLLGDELTTREDQLTKERITEWTNRKEKKIISEHGKVMWDTNTNIVMVEDTPSNIEAITRFIESVDRTTPQVMIEARIVEMSSTNAKDLGVQWGLNLSAKNTLSAFGGNTGLGKGSFTGGNYLVDFPSGSSGADSGSGFNFGILNPARTLGLDLQISALEKIGKSRIISNPKIVTTDNQKASILQGTEEPYPMKDPQSGQISTGYKKVGLNTEITPHITPDGSINMSVKVTKADILGYVSIGGSQVPRTSIIDSDTKVLVKDGETLVIGGVYKKKDGNSTSGVPGLVNIPLLGWLFKNKADTEETTELLIFITPRIIEKP